MKIAILIPGHLRAWEMCRDNFLSNLYDIENHEIDVFVNTYYKQFVTGALNKNEASNNTVLSYDEILSLFEGINVVSFIAEDENLDPAYVEKQSYYGTSQLDKLKNCFKVFEEYCNLNKKDYDLVVRTRFDITVDKKVNYDGIYKSCLIQNNKVYIGNGVHVSGPNDMLAIGFKNSIKIMLEREYINVGCVEDRLSMDGSLWHKIIRFNGNMSLVPEQHYNNDNS